MIVTMITDGLAPSGGKDLPELAISFNEYLSTVTTVERGASGSVVEGITRNFESIINDLSSDHSLRIASKPFQDEILDQYRTSLSETNLKYMVGITFSDAEIKAWFNNQAYHTAPLVVNTFHNAVLR